MIYKATYIMGMSIYTCTHKTEVRLQDSRRHNIGGEDKPIGLTILSPMDQVRYQVRNSWVFTHQMFTPYLGMKDIEKYQPGENR